MSYLVGVDGVAVLLGQELGLGDVDHEADDGDDDGICD